MLRALHRARTKPGSARVVARRFVVRRAQRRVNHGVCEEQRKRDLAAAAREGGASSDATSAVPARAAISQRRSARGFPRGGTRGASVVPTE